MVRPRHVGVTDGVDDEPGEVDGLGVQRAPGVQAGQQQEVVDEFGHALGLRADPAQGVRDVLGQVLPPESWANSA